MYKYIKSISEKYNTIRILSIEERIYESTC